MKFSFWWCSFGIINYGKGRRLSNKTNRSLIFMWHENDNNCVTDVSLSLSFCRFEVLYLCLRDYPFSKFLRLKLCECVCIGIYALILGIEISLTFLISEHSVESVALVSDSRRLRFIVQHQYCFVFNGILLFCLFYFSFSVFCAFLDLFVWTLACVNGRGRGMSFGSIYRR